MCSSSHVLYFVNYTYVLEQDIGIITITFIETDYLNSLDPGSSVTSCDSK